MSSWRGFRGVDTGSMSDLLSVRSVTVSFMECEMLKMMDEGVGWGRLPDTGRTRASGRARGDIPPFRFMMTVWYGGLMKAACELQRVASGGCWCVVKSFTGALIHAACMTDAWQSIRIRTLACDLN